MHAFDVHQPLLFSVNYRRILHSSLYLSLNSMFLIILSVN